MKKLKICTFAANYNHAAIVIENFLKNEFENVDVLFICEKEQKSIRNIVTCSNIKYLKWKDEYCVNNGDKTIFVVYGSENFIYRVNKFINFSNKDAYVIAAYDISNIESDIKNIISLYDYYLNTQGLQIKY